MRTKLPMKTSISLVNVHMLLSFPFASFCIIPISIGIILFVKYLLGEQTAEEKAVCTQSAKKNVDKAVAEKKKKKEVINKSTLVIEIKPNNLDTDLIAVEKAVREIKMDGLDWAQASKKVPIAFGLNKLQMGCSIVDDLIATDDIIERIESIGMTQAQADEYRKKREAGDNDDDEEEEAPGWVQSAEIVSFQKL